MELEKDSKVQPGINLLHYQNPETGINDVTMIVFDLRLFQKEVLAARPQLSDAITNLGIMQQPAPSAAQASPVVEASMAQAELPQGEPGLFTQ